MEDLKQPELRHGMFAVDDVELHYVMAGSGPLLLCLHGFPQHWYAFRHVIAEFAPDHTVVAVDLRGVNQSSRPSKLRDNGVWAAVDDMAALVKHLGFETCTVVGHDWGGAIGYAMALHRPAQVERLVILSASHPATFDRELHHNPEQIKGGGHWLFLRTRHSAERLAANDCAALKAIFTEHDFFSEADLAAYLEAWRRPGAVDGMVAWYHKEGWGPAEGDTPAYGNYVREQPSLVISQPTLVIYGDQDKFLHVNNYVDLQRWVKRLDIHVIAGASHWILDEHPVGVNAMVRRFFSESGSLEPKIEGDRHA
jgi:pimeloyl-ACP methyl ester carboxylesterase